MFNVQRTLIGLSVTLAAFDAWAQTPVVPVPESSSYTKQQEKKVVPPPVAKGQDTAKGFFADDSLKLTTRNFYSRESSPDPKYRYNKNGGRATTHARNTWVQGTILQYSSGYTQGPVGLGLDVAGYQAINLERGKARVASGGNRTLVDSSGRGVDEWSKLGVADVRFRVSNTELKAGRFQLDTPVINSYDNRALPSSFNGFGVNSAEIDGVGVQFGSITRVSPRTGAGEERLTTEYGTRGVVADRFSFLGATYKAPYNTDVTLYGARFEDVWDQYYLGLVQRSGNAETVAWKTAVNGYRTTDSGSAKAGNIDNTAMSAAITATHQAHSLTLSYQQIFGNSYFDYVHETAAIFLANAAFSDFNGPNEKSLRLRYDTDWAAFGVPGFTTSLYYITGWDIDGTHYNPGAGKYANYADVLAMDDEKHHEYGFITTYVVQTGALKNSRFNFRVTDHVASNHQVDGNVREVRLSSTFPFNFL